jgi:hypothetical protein
MTGRRVSDPFDTFRMYFRWCVGRCRAPRAVASKVQHDDLSSGLGARLRTHRRPRPMRSPRLIAPSQRG